MKKIIQIFVKNDGRIFGLGDDSNIYEWEYMSSSWIFYGNDKLKNEGK